MEKKPEKVVLKLEEPIQFGSELVKEVHFRAPKAKDMRKIKFPPESGDLIDLAIEIGDQPKSVMDELSAQDTMKLLEVVSNFLVGGQKTGN